MVGKDALSDVAGVTVTPGAAVAATWEPDDDDEERDEDDRQGRKVELRTYTVTDEAGNTLTLVVKVKRTDRHIRARLVSVQSGGGSPEHLPWNTVRVKWAETWTGELRDLDQRMRAGRGQDRQTVTAGYDPRKNETTMKVERPRPERKVTKAGMVVLRLVVDKVKLTTEY